MSDLIERLKGAFEALMNYQQADEDGVMVLTSRQAIHEANEALPELIRLSEALEASKEREERLREALERIEKAGTLSFTTHGGWGDVREIARQALGEG